MTRTQYLTLLAKLYDTEAKIKITTRELVTCCLTELALGKVKVIGELIEDRQKILVELNQNRPTV